MTTFQKGVIIIAGIVILGMILYPPYQEKKINRGYASLFKYPTIMKTVPKYEYANEFYKFSDEQVRVPDKVYTSSFVNILALSIQLAGVLIISSVLWVLGKASYLNRTALDKYSRFNKILSLINVLWFFGILFSLTLPHLLSYGSLHMLRSLLQLAAFITPILTIWALHPHADIAPRLLAFALNIVTALYIILMHTVTASIGWLVFIDFWGTILYLSTQPLTCFLILIGIINAVAVLIPHKSGDTNKPPAQA